MRRGARWRWSTLRHHENGRRSARYPSVASVEWSAKAPLVVMALGTRLHAGARDSNGPTPIEKEQIERACSARHDPRTPETDDHLESYGTKLATLRAEFGPDLNRVSRSERKRLDSMGGRLAIAERREA